MPRRLIIGILLAVLWCEGLHAKERQGVRDTLRRATTLLHEEQVDSLPEARNQRLYDSLRAKAGRRTLSRLLYNWLTVNDHEEPMVSGLVLKPEKIYGRYAGCSIRSIRIIRHEPFDSLGNRLERIANKIHVLTRERIIRRDLIFKEGDKVDPDELVYNLQLLKGRSYISDAKILVRPVEGEPSAVDIEVITRDSWTITMDAYLKSGGETMIGLSDDNILGCGDRFAIKTHFSRSDFSYGGNTIEFHIPNLAGSFYEVDFDGGREFDLSRLKIKIEKPFIRPTDYLLGTSFTREKERYTSRHTGLKELFRTQEFELHSGFSHQFTAIRSSLYLLAQYTRQRYGERPEVAPRYNPFFHERDQLLGSVGLYREQFITTNMIFGYGTREYIPTGYRAELTGGYIWGEFYDDYYVGMALRGGDYTSKGYFYGGIELGSYISATGGLWHRAGMDLDLKWFSNLLAVRRCHLRQFAEVNYTQGWRRLLGYDERISYNDDNGIRMMKEDPNGFTRMAINTETVVFTPLQPWGFRLTFYGYFDFGTMGYRDNPFQNAFYSSLGFGVRIKNERLIFGAVQLQFGIALGKGGLLDTRWFEASSQGSYQRFEFRPKEPEFVAYK